MLSGLSLVGVLGFFAAGGLGLTQDPQGDKTPIQNSPPAPPPFAVRDRQNATIEVVYRWEQLKDVSEQFKCGNECKGGHKSHAECEKKDCDRKCTETHRLVFEAEVDDFEPGISDFARNIQRLDNSGKECGIDKMPSPQILRSARVELNEEAFSNDYNVEVNWDHWCTASCTTQTRTHKWAVFQLLAQVTPKKFSPALNTLVTGSPVDLHIADLYIPTGVFEDASPFKFCQCIDWELFPMPRSTSRTSFFPEPHDVRDGYITVTKEGSEYALGPNLRTQFQLEASVKSMNEIEWSAINYSSTPVDINIYPGVTLQPKDPAYQDIIATTAVKLHLPGTQRGPFAERVAVTGRGMCLNMHKSQPTGSTPYTVSGSTSQAMVNLAKLYNRESFKTVEGQIRMWIATDQASLSEIQKYLMFPKPSPAQYLHALHAVNKSGRVNLSNPSYAKCLDPSLIGGAPSSGSQIRWFVKLMQKLNPKGLAASAKNPANFADLWTPSAERYQAAYVRDLANVLAKSPDQAVALSTVDFLMMVPEPLRAKVDEEGGLSTVCGWLRRKDPKFAEAANRVIEAYKSKEAEIALLNVNPALPESIKAKSAELLKALYP